ncbi:hypothetical protein GCM10010324_60990 [Streptomyces hiroshimensis]|uniref:Uncharacterized protein n=1 Tax=Streptomyces hiroshimensis TaxID=66424 RepID=A0ABQ2Z8H2_9ACTN|nr:hypothetical protein GCM10010324_60990 [Streptomyces hiroshimensis]
MGLSVAVLAAYTTLMGVISSLPPLPAPTVSVPCPIGRGSPAGPSAAAEGDEPADFTVSAFVSLLQAARDRTVARQKAVTAVVRIHPPEVRVT